MARDVLTIAQKYMRRKDFSSAIKILEARYEIYEDNFDYYILLGTACLYAGDAGSAYKYYQKARDIKLIDTTLLLGQAALFLRRGDTNRAIQYYLEVRESEPQNKIAKSALEFIRTSGGDYGTICRWIDDGRIKKFYPPITTFSPKIFSFLIPVFACAIGVLFTLAILNNNKTSVSGNRADLSSFVLSSTETKNAQETGMPSSAYKFNLSNKEITDSYILAQKYFQSYRDNAAQIEINRILNSNAISSIKRKARTLMDFLKVPTFDTVKDSPAYNDVVKNIDLYMDCYTVWSGRVANEVIAGESYIYDFLVGYETQKNIVGVVTVKFASNPNISISEPLKILGKVTTENGKLCLIGKSVYQNVTDLLENP